MKPHHARQDGIEIRQKTEPELENAAGNEEQQTAVSPQNLPHPKKIETARNKNAGGRRNNQETGRQDTP